MRRVVVTGMGIVSSIGGSGSCGLPGPNMRPWLHSSRSSREYADFCSAIAVRSIKARFAAPFAGGAVRAVPDMGQLAPPRFPRPNPTLRRFVTHPSFAANPWATGILCLRAGARRP